MRYLNVSLDKDANNWAVKEKIKDKAMADMNLIVIKDK